METESLKRVEVMQGILESRMLGHVEAIEQQLGQRLDEMEEQLREEGRDFEHRFLEQSTDAMCGAWDALTEGNSKAFGACHLQTMRLEELMEELAERVGQCSIPQLIPCHSEEIAACTWQNEELATAFKEESSSLQKELAKYVQTSTSKLGLLRDCWDGLQERMDAKEEDCVRSFMDVNERVENVQEHINANEEHCDRSFKTVNERVENIFRMLTTLEGELEARVQEWASDAEMVQSHADTVQSCVAALEKGLQGLHADVAGIASCVSIHGENISSFESAFSGYITVMMAAALGILRKTPRSQETLSSTLMASALRALLIIHSTPETMTDPL